MTDYDSLTIQALRGEVIRLEQSEQTARLELQRLRSDEWLETAAHEISQEQPSPDSLDWQETLVILRKHRDGKA